MSLKVKDRVVIKKSCPFTQYRGKLAEVTHVSKFGVAVELLGEEINQSVFCVPNQKCLALVEEETSSVHPAQKQPLKRTKKKKKKTKQTEEWTETSKLNQSLQD